MLKTKEQLDPCKVELSIEVEPDKVAQAFEKAYTHLSKAVTIPGFRKGKAPRHLVERYLDEESVKDRAARELIPDAYKDALREAEIEPFDHPELEVVRIEKEQPCVFKATVSLPPKVKLGDYVGLTIEKMTAIVTDEDVECQIDKWRDRDAKLEPVEGRPVRESDYVDVELQRMDDDSEAFTRITQAGSNVPSFDEGIIGMVVGEERTIDISYPDDHDDTELAGKTIPLRAKVLEIKERRLPDLNDFAASFDAESVEVLREMVKSKMQEGAEEMANRQVESQLLYQIVDNSEICFPESLLHEESELRFQGLVRQLSESKVELTDYLRRMNQTLDELREEIDRNAERDLKEHLALFEIADREKIAVSDEDIEAEIQKMADARGVPKASMQAYIDSSNGVQRMSMRLLRGKALVFLLHASNIKNVAAKGDSH